MIRNRHLLLAVGLSSVILLASTFSRACLVCVSAPLETVLVSELEGAAEVVLAEPVGERDENRYRIETVYRGPATLRAGDEVVATLPLFSEDGGKVGTGAVLLTRRNHKADWFVRAPGEEHHTEFFDFVLTLPPPDSKDALDELNRAVFFAGYLHHEDAILARAGAAELIRLPYPVLKKIRTRLDLATIRGALQSPATADRFALFYTLLGLCGNEEDAGRLRKLIDNSWQRNGWRNLGALLTAYLELEGETAVEEIETRYFRDRNRTLPEIEQAVLALRLHGNADDSISRQRAIKAFRTFFDDREPLASLIIADLARWKDWESKERLLELAGRRGKDLPDIQRQVDAFLVICPR